MKPATNGKSSCLWLPLALSINFFQFFLPPLPCLCLIVKSIPEYAPPSLKMTFSEPSFHIIPNTCVKEKNIDSGKSQPCSLGCFEHWREPPYCHQREAEAKLIL